MADDDGGSTDPKKSRPKRDHGGSEDDAKEKSSRADGFPADYVALVAKKDPELLTTAFDTVMREGEYPQMWKKADVVLIPKKDWGNFRAIALLSRLGKLFERVVAARIKSIWNASPNQYGFVKGRETKEAS
uniref:Reverse transcriptase domain-containing protein n=1 Tax=Photinus pyralis TaxID=7054 RepID=A0A1Y1KTI6_PHOPY